MVWLCSNDEWCLSRIALGRNVGATAHEKMDEFRLAHTHGPHEWCFAIHVPQFDVGSAIHELVGHVDVALFNGVDECAATTFVTAEITEE